MSKKNKSKALKPTKAKPAKEVAQKQSSGPSLSELFADLPAFTKSPWLILLVLMFVGLIFRMYTTMWEPVIYPDSTQYMTLAGEFSDLSFFKPGYELNEGFIKSRHLPPVYSFLLAIVSVIPVELEILGIWLSIIMSTLTMIPAFIIGKRLHSPTAGLIGAALMCFHAYVLQYATPLLTEATYSFFYTSTIAAGLLAFDKKSTASFAICGAIAALSYMTRDAGIAAIALLSGWAVLYYFLVERLGLSRIALLVAVLIGAFLLTCLPYFVHIRVRTGHFGLTVQMDNEKVTEQILLFGGDRWDRDRLPGKEKGTELLDENPQTSLSGVLINLPGLSRKLVLNGYAYAGEFSKALAGYNKKDPKWRKLNDAGKVITGLFKVPVLFMFVCFGFAGIDFYRRRSRRNLFTVLYLFSWMLELLLLYALVTPYMVDDRYTYPLMIPALIFAGAGIAIAAQGLAWLIQSKSSNSATIGKAVLVSFSVAMIGLAYYQNLQALTFLKDRMSPKTLPTKYASGHKLVAKHILENHQIEPGLKMLGRKPFMAYYLGADHFLIPKTYEEIEQMRDKGEAELLVADSFTMKYTRPLLIELGFGLHTPQPGRIIYNRIYPEYRRVITVYDLREKTQKPPTPGLSNQQRIERSAALFGEGYLYDAATEAIMVINADPQNLNAHLIMARIYAYYYQVTGVVNTLPYAVNAYEKYLKLNPGDELSEREYANLKNTLDELIKKARQKKKAQAEKNIKAAD